MALTDRQMMTIASAARLLARAPEVLSDAELETVASVGERVRCAGRLAMVAKDEWSIVEEAVERLEGAVRARLLPPAGARRL